MEEFVEPASALYQPVLADVIGCVDVPDKPRSRGGILITFVDERGTLVTIRLLRSATDSLLKALQAGSTDSPARLKASLPSRYNRELIPITTMKANGL